MENIVHGLIQLYETNELLQHESEDESKLIEMQRKKYILGATSIFLEMLYALVIIMHKGISFSNFCSTAYTGICVTTAISKAWNLYMRIYDDQKLRTKTTAMYFLL